MLRDKQRRAELGLPEYRRLELYLPVEVYEAVEALAKLLPTGKGREGREGKGTPLGRFVRQMVADHPAVVIEMERRKSAGWVRPAQEATDEELDVIAAAMIEKD